MSGWPWREVIVMAANEIVTVSVGLQGRSRGWASDPRVHRKPLPARWPQAGPECPGDGSNASGDGTMTRDDASYGELVRSDSPCWMSSRSIR
jgi:hypothetical protein